MKNIYLTIDDAPSGEFGRKLEYLSKNNIPAVFFCIGESIEKNRAVLKEALKLGFYIHNHSFSHPHFSDLTLDECREQILSTEKLLEELYGEAGISRENKFFRFPFGDKGTSEEGDFFEVMDPRTEEGKFRKKAIQDYLKSLGYRAPVEPSITYKYLNVPALKDDVDVLWSYDSYDWAVGMDNPPHGLGSLDKLLDRMDENVPEQERGLNTPGSDDIFLCHDFDGMEEVFEALMDKLKLKTSSFKLLK